jgi:transcriptional regulator with XRE-family HTH domain
MVGLTDSYLSQILSGRRRPGLDAAVRIESVTGIPAVSWSSKALADADRRKERAAARARLRKELTSAVAG